MGHHPSKKAPETSKAKAPATGNNLALPVEHTKTRKTSRRSSTTERKVIKTDEEWEQQLTPQQFQVTRLKKDDGKNGEFVNEEKSGVYLCICCDEPLFDSTKKFVSPDGRCAFLAHLGMVEHVVNGCEGCDEKTAEAICNRCGAHLGFCTNDGPEPTGVHFSINSVAIKFIFAEEEKVDDDLRNLIQSPNPPHDAKLEKLMTDEFDTVIHKLDTPKAAPSVLRVTSLNVASPVDDIRTMLQSPVANHYTGQRGPAFFGDNGIAEDGDIRPVALNLEDASMSDNDALSALRSP